MAKLVVLDRAVRWSCEVGIACIAVAEDAVHDMTRH